MSDAQGLMTTAEAFYALAAFLLAWAGATWLLRWAVRRAFRHEVA